MKILFVADTYYPHINGVYYFIQRLALQLKACGHEVAVLAPSASWEHTITEIDGITVFGISTLPMPYYKSVRIPFPFKLKKQVSNIIDDYNPDVIHLQGHFALSKMVLAVNKKHNIPVIATNHFMTENLTCFIPWNKLHPLVERWLWHGFSKVFNKTVCVTTPTLTAANIIRPKLNVTVIPVSNGINLERFSTVLNINCVRKKFSIPVKPILLSVGRLDPEKHLDEVLEAAAIALKKSNFCLVIAGKGREKNSLEKLAINLGIQKNVIFTGFVPDEDLPRLYRISTCFITASIAELQSLATMEAMASGLPVIATDAGALAELVHHQLNGYLSKPGSVETMAASITNIFNSHDLQVKMGEMSLRYIRQHDIGKTVTKYEELYNTVVRKQHQYNLNKFIVKKEVVV